jgi:hypothetical protein
MTTDLSIDKRNKIIQRTVSGEIHTERSLQVVREVAATAASHKDYHILMDLREAVASPEMFDLMTISSACSRLGSEFSNKIAFVISYTTERRVRFGERFKACMKAQGFVFELFFDYDHAREWLTH